MSYATSAANDPNELLDKLRLFAQGHGWAIDGFRDRASNVGKALSLHVGDLYATFVSQLAGGDANNPAPFLGAFGHSGYVANASPDVQADASAVCWANYVQGPYSVAHFFGRAAAVPTHRARDASRHVQALWHGPLGHSRRGEHRAVHLRQSVVLLC